MTTCTQLHYTEIDTPIGPLVLVASPQGLCKVEFGTAKDNREGREQWARRWYGEHELIQLAEPLAAIVGQVAQYFQGERKDFDVEIDLRGTDFQKRVWQALQAVPYGETASYKHIAEAIGSPKAVRAVGGANNQNPVPIIIPCHRIIGASGDLVGYGGGLPTKIHLLDLEERTL
ncbi:methylated-DNA--[protein]-cysteine S-methyltransferase [Paenibacillus roseipurpureus]|uniref:Methylated-DNA--protein-cysteine methyltransferase n=1 Tax=Paenibacillus roseopurpureus TaxID=2918901 RepID=A0AA96LSB1_9BACL|nr:methylated-DNA--[protein]-cysteine S-methyltransferase [Paenibacillus sp. MBLB1832]WNR45013.1 methylated-DNA--[protein]-cysteine S-methyltransferase [Paenibacillus sp. MBLB1832]